MTEAAAKRQERTTARSRRGFVLRVLVQLAAILLVIVFAIRERHTFTGFASTMTRIVWYWIILSFLAELASIPPLAETQLVIMRAGGARPKRWPMILVTLASNAISMSVPAGVAVAEGYAYAQYRRFGATRAIAAWSELASGAIAFAALAGVALVGAIIAGGQALPILLPILSVVFSGATGAALLFRHPHLLVSGLAWLERHVGRRIGGLVARATKQAREISTSMKDMHPSIRTWTAAAVYSTVNWFLDVLSLALAFLAVGAHVPWGVVLLAFAGAKVISSIGITPAGLGFVEGGLVATFVAYGTPGSAATAAVLVYRGITLIGLVGTGLVVAGVLSVRARRADERRARRAE